MKNAVTQLSTLLVLSLFLSACGGGGGSSSEQSPIPATSSVAPSSSSATSSNSVAISSSLASSSSIASSNTTTSASSLASSSSTVNSSSTTSSGTIASSSKAASSNSISLSSSIASSSSVSSSKAASSSSISSASSLASSSSTSSSSSLASSSSISSSSKAASSSSIALSSSSAASSIANTENQLVTEYHTTHTIYNIEHCGENISAPNKTTALFGDYDTTKQNQSLTDITGWNHLTNGSTTEWKNTKLAATDYNNPSTGKTNSACNNVDTLNMVLVKKYADWDRQHANGFESHITTKNISFGQVESIVVDLKINSARTTIPTTKKLVDTYSSYTAESNITALDTSKVNIGFTLYDGTNLKAADIIELDQGLYADKWIRVVIKLSDISFYSEVNYVRTTKKPEDLSSAIINGLLIVGETKTGNVLRGNIGNWSTNVPETFKEMDINFKKIEFILK